MKPVLIFLVALVSLITTARAQDVAAAADETRSVTEGVKGTPDLPYIGAEVTLEQFKWQARPIVVLADSPLDPAFRQQMELFRAAPERLIERDVKIITDTDTSTPSDVRTRLRPHGFMLVIIGKDGQVALRKPRPWSAQEISRIIDNMPIRQQEVRDQWRDR